MSNDRLAAVEARLAKLEAVLGRDPIVLNEDGLIAAMVRYAARLTGLEPAELWTRRTARHCHARFAVMYAARESLGYSLTRIGRAFGVDHTTILNGYRRAVALIDADPLFRTLVERLLATFRRILADPDIQEATLA